MTEKKLIRIAKQEIEQWHTLPPSLVLAILWAFIYRITRGRPIEEDCLFKQQESVQDFQI